jgi:predicted RNase H-like HicB family nuclease
MTNTTGGVMKIVLSSLVFVVLLATNTVVFSRGKYVLTVHNTAPITIYLILPAEHGKVIGEAGKKFSIMPAVERGFSLEVEEGKCVWRMKAHFQTGHVVEDRDVNVCKEKKWTIRDNRPPPHILNAQDRRTYSYSKRLPHSGSRICISIPDCKLQNIEILILKIGVLMIYSMCMKKILLKNLVWKEGTVYVAQCLNVDVSSFGKTRKEALANVSEALELYFDSPKKVSDIQHVSRPEIVEQKFSYAEAL